MGPGEVRHMDPDHMGQCTLQLLHETLFRQNPVASESKLLVCLLSLPENCTLQQSVVAVTCLLHVIMHEGKRI